MSGRESHAEGPPNERRAAIGLMCLAFAVYNANLHGIAAGDSLPARFIPVAVLLHGTVRLDSVYTATRMGHPKPYWIKQSVDGHFVSMYPVVTPLLVTPLYVPAFAVWRLAGGGERRLELMGEVMEKVSASIIASLSVGLFYRLLRRWLGGRDAGLLVVAYAFGTNTWVTGSQGLWQHGAGELFLIVALLCVTGTPSVGAAIGTGVFCGLVVANRPPDVFLALGICAFAGLSFSPRRTWIVALSATATVLPFLFHNWITFHSWGGGYTAVAGRAPGGFAGFLRNPVLPGIAALLVSPGKGLFVFGPLFAFLCLAPKKRFAARRDRTLALCLAAAVVLQMIFYAKFDWRAGFSYGPRFLTDAVPILVFLLVPVVEGVSLPGRAVFVVLVVVSILVQAIGAFCYPRGASDIGLDPWSWKRSPIVVEAGAGLMPFTFLTYAKKVVRGDLAPLRADERDPAPETPPDRATPTEAPTGAPGR